MSLMSLRESLAHSKDKWKKRLRLNSRSASPTRPGADKKPAASTPEADNQPAKGSIAWSGLKTLLRALESSSDVFSPLKSALDRLSQCRASKGRKDYDELREKLDGLLNDLAEHMAQPMDRMMTNSVTLLCRGIEAEARKVEENQSRSMGVRLMEAMDTSGEILECYRRVHGHLERLTLNANMGILKAINELTMEARLKGMSPAMSAIYDSAESDEIKRAGCTPGTRQPQIDLLLEWAHDPDAGRTCWMNGMAGTGKTTLAYSVCTVLEQASALGASFFCSHVIPECRQVKHIIPTIAYQLARYSLPFRLALDKVLELNPDARTRTLRIQYQKLLVEPLVEVQDSLPSDFIVVIDALDECDNEESLGQILDLLLSPTTVLPIRFLVSSRPEPGIARRMRRRVGDQDPTQLVLHDLNADGVKADIETYMRHELEHIPLTESQWTSLIEQCGVLFIYASTACRLIEQGHEVQTLNETISIIGGSASTYGFEDENAVDELYSVILAAAFNKAKLSPANRWRRRELLETIICAIEPMSLEALAALLGLEGAGQVNALLQPLRSVLNITSSGMVTTLHASFPDFMLSSGRSAAFHCVAVSRHSALAESSLRMIDAIKPQFNICGLPSSYLADNEVKDLDERVRHSISPGLVYTCRHWSTHLYLGDYNEKLVDVARNFFTEGLLIWMEILNLTGKMRFGTSIIRDAEEWCHVSW
ncbi:vegetative incompatibility protein HET-E-1, partial [Rhizoctonia solani AG-3 Rhs1AP]